MKDCLTPKKVGVGAVLLCIATIVIRWGIISPAIKAEVSKKVRLEPGTKIWDFWTDIPIPIFIKFYFFNVTNAEQVLVGEKPILEELGPYVYEEKRRKIIVNVNDETVKYRPKTHYYFRPELSRGSDEDNVTMLNVPFVGIIKMAWDLTKEPFLVSTLGELLDGKGEKIFHTHKVREFLFDGVSIRNYMELLSMPMPDMLGDGIEIPAIPKRLLDGDFGFFDDKNGTTDDLWVVHTGKGKNEDMAMAIEWNGLKKLKFWKDDKCNKIEGTDGTMFPPFTDQKRSLKAFSPDFCRSVEMVYEKPSEFLGIPTMRFVMAPKLFGSVKEFPENECFCRDIMKYCEKGGIISLAPCIGGAPVFASRPHFSGAHKDFVDAVIGLSPNGDYHSFVDVEPEIGLPLRGTMRMQINIDVEPYDTVEAFTSLPTLLFPLLWAEEVIAVNPEVAAPILDLVHGIKILDCLAITSIVISVLAFLGALIWGGVRKQWHLKLAALDRVRS